MYTLIQGIEVENPRRTLLFKTGDTIQDSAEALDTEGQAIVDVLDHFGIDGFAPGNWDYVYGTDRFIELFGSGRWGAVAMNVYYSDELYPERAGELVLPPYIMKNIDGIRVAILGISSERAINAMGAWRTEGLVFTGEGEELPHWIDVVRNQERADVVVLLSEYGLAKNIDLANRCPGIDVLLSADMHEETPEPIYSTNGTLQPNDTGAANRHRGRVYRPGSVPRQFLAGGFAGRHRRDVARLPGRCVSRSGRGGHRFDPRLPVWNSRAPGSILIEDLYHYMPIGPQIAKITNTGQQLKNQMENAADGSFIDDVFIWTGGWFFGYSGVRADMDPYASKGSRFTNIEVMRWGSATWEPLDLAAGYTYAGYWFEQEPESVNDIRPRKALRSSPMPSA